MPEKTPAHVRDQIVAMRKQDPPATYSQIREKLGVTDPVIARTLKEAGMTKRKPSMGSIPPPSSDTTPTEMAPATSSLPQASPSSPTTTAAPAANVRPGSEAVRALQPTDSRPRQNTSPQQEETSTPKTEERADDQDVADEDTFECGACGAVMAGDVPKQCLGCGVDFE